jgi:predicted phage baseplate assembly protein
LSGWTDSDANVITVYFNLVEAAKVIIPEKDTLEQTDTIQVPGYIDETRVPVSNLLFEDVHNDGTYSGGSLSFIDTQANLNTSPEWGKSLVAPVNVYGNVFLTSRGESIEDEILGSGDASLEYQEFKLKKKPLTYTQADTAKGYVTTLTVRVGNVVWDEVATFYGTAKEDTVYVVRHDEEGETYIKFGGAARLPSAAVVTASYRFGAGAKVPPAGSITQLAKPIDGINTVKNILAAFGGGDAESMDEIKYYAPRSALLLGRTVSLVDLEAAAHRVTGVKAVRAIWRWDKNRSEKRAIIYYIGDAQLSSSILSSLKTMSEPGAPIEVKQSQPQAAVLMANLEIHENYKPEQVIADVQNILYEAPSPGYSGGLLRAERLGPEGVVYNSHVIDAIMEINGVVNIETITFDNTPLEGYGRRPDSEHYFDFGELGSASSGISINGVV